VREVAEDQNDPNHLVVLHRHVATLLVKHGISTWEQLRSSFPGTTPPPPATLRLP